MLVDRRVWPELGLVGVARRGESRGQRLLLIADSDDRWMLYLEPPWSRFHYGESIFSFDNNLLWDADAQKISDEWDVDWMEPGVEEEIVEQEVFDVRRGYIAYQSKQSKRQSRRG